MTSQQQQSKPKQSKLTDHSGNARDIVKEHNATKTLADIIEFLSKNGFDSIDEAINRIEVLTKETEKYKNSVNDLKELNQNNVEEINILVEKLKQKDMFIKHIEQTSSKYQSLLQKAENKIKIVKEFIKTISATISLPGIPDKIKRRLSSELSAVKRSLGDK